MPDSKPSSQRQDLPVSEDNHKVKKRRLRGACDTCRKKKAKCDSAETPGNVCTNCIASKIECSHDAPRKTLTLQNETCIQTLEARIERLQEYIRRTHPDEDIDCIISMSPDDSQAEVQVHERTASSSPQDPSPQSILSEVDHLPAKTTLDQSEISEDDDLAHVALANHFATISINTNRFFGQSSAFMFAKHASTMRNEVIGKDNVGLDPRRHRRPIFWETLPWELSFASSIETPYVYPPDDLLRSLVALYFEKTNCLIPILHQPTFMRSLLSGQHHSDPSFGMTVLVVCAIGSRYSQDSRVTVTNDASGLSSGWHYFCQVPIHRKISLFDTTIYDLQYYALASLYVIGTSIPHASWILLGIGIRFALEKGAHRRKGNHQKPSAEVELQKRAFWAIVCLDRIGSAFVGRPYGYPHEAFDIEYPIECDDKYWEADDPDKAFQQPPGEPCSITAFIFFIKLCEILGFTLRTLYANKKSKLSSGFVGNDWEARMVAELDSSMNKWKDSLPEHLLWDPERQNALFFHQSANLHTTYHYLQIQIHRPFLTRSSSLSFVSLAMCTNAARSCSHILEAAMTRGLRILPTSMTAAFIAGLFIAIGLRSGPRSQFTWDPEKDRENLQKCIDVLKECEKRWHCAGRLSDMLIEAGAISEYQPSKTSKRRHQSFNVTEASSQGPLPATWVFDQGITGDETNNSSTSDAYATALPMNDWDLQQLFLRELGYPPPNNSLANGGNIFGLENGGPAYTDQDASSISATAQSSNPQAGNNAFPLWSDNSTAAFSSFEEWEAYLSSAGLL